MKKILLSIIRDKNTQIAEFRKTAAKLSYILAQEASEYLNKEKIEIETPYGKISGLKLKKTPKLAVIWRAGLALLDGFLNYFENSEVGFIGLKRDEITAIAKQYYLNLPKISNDDQVILLDPTIATGGSAIAALNILKEYVPEENIIFVAVLASSEGLKNIREKFKRIKIILVTEDPELNNKKFIVPGFGDFGDRYFGTED